MPLYEYVCKACSHPFEELSAQGQSHAPCPKCAAKDAERVAFSRTAVGKSHADAACESPCASCTGDGGCGRN